MTGQTIDIEALARLLVGVRIDPARLELAVREALDNPTARHPGSGPRLDPLTGTDIRALAEALDINIGYFDRFYREQNDMLKGIGFATRSFRTEAVGYQRVFARAVILNNILLGLTIALLITVLGLVLFLAWPALVSGHQENGDRERGGISLCCSGTPAPGRPPEE